MDRSPPRRDRELETSSDPVMIAVAGNVLSQYGTMLAPSEKARVGHLVEAEKLFRRRRCSIRIIPPGNRCCSVRRR